MRKLATLFSLALVATITASACSDGREPQGGHTPSAAASGKIAFVSCQVKKGEDPWSQRLCDIHLINADGSGLANLTNSPSYDIPAPVWSPDGSRIAFAYMNDDGSTDIFVVNADGSGLVNLTSDLSYDREPVWSPDGSRIAFTSRTDPAAEPGATFGVYGDDDIKVINADGTGRVNLSGGRTVDHLGDPALDHFPRWSPDGSRLSFLSGPYITVMSADGSGLLSIESDVFFESAPMWSPDGNSLVTSADDGEIYLLSVDSTSRVRLTDSDEYDSSPAWSPDGKRITFIRDEDPYVMNADGSGLDKVTGPISAFYGESLGQSPDGSRFAFSAEREEHAFTYTDAEGYETSYTPREIYIVNAGDSDPQRVTDSPADDFGPAWQPLP